MNILAWLTFIGLMIKAGAILISYTVSIGNPNGAKNLYMGLNLYNLRQYNFLHYTNAVSFMVAIIALEAFTAYLVIIVLSKIKLSNPFTAEVSRLLERISYIIFVTWLVSLFYEIHTKWLMGKVAGLQENPSSVEALFLAGVVFIFSQIFKKGVELQSEHELTV